MKIPFWCQVLLVTMAMLLAALGVYLALTDVGVFDRGCAVLLTVLSMAFVAYVLSEEKTKTGK